MKKNKIMRLASALLVLTLMTTCAISSTFAKYTTSASGTDSARVAKWGFTPTTITLTDLFKNTYDATVQGATDVIAPGTKGQATFGFNYGGADGINAPEVAYTFDITVDTADSNTTNLDADESFVWKLDNNEYQTLNELKNAIEALEVNGTPVAGKANNYYAPGTLPTAFSATGTNEHTVGWEWKFDGQDSKDTALGNETTLENVNLTITVEAVQVD